MFVLLVSRGVPSPKDPHWGCFERDQAEALSALGHKVVVVSVDGRFRWYYRKIGTTQTIINGLEYWNIFLFPLVFLSYVFGKKCSYILESKLLSYMCSKLIRKHGKPDLIYSHFLPNSYLALRLKQKYNIPLVVIEHWSEINKDEIKSWVRLMGDLVYKNADNIVVVSDSLRKRIKQHFDMNSVVVHNMANQSFFKGDFHVKERGSKLMFVTTGRLIYGKGFDLLIAAFDKLKLPADLWELNIIGDGEKRDNLQTQINEAGLQSNIHLLGQKNKEEIVVLLSQSDVFVLPSRNENFSVAVIEALACGLPVIASICGGIRECIEDFNGLLFPVNDVDRLADAIKYMFEHYDQYDRGRISKDCKNRFSPEIIARQLTQIFEQTVMDYNTKQRK